MVQFSTFGWIAAVTLVTTVVKDPYSIVPSVIPMLRAIPFFAGVSNATIERLAARCIPREVGAGFTLFREGEEPRGLYFVLKGQVRVYRLIADGREQTLVVESAGRPVTEFPVFDGGNYASTAVTVTPSQLAFLPRAEFEHAFRTEPEVAAAVARALGQRVRHLVRMLEIVALRDVATRLALLLADYADRQGVSDGEGMVLDLPRTQDQLATEIGTARESISRALKQLIRAGVIKGRVGSRFFLPASREIRDWARSASQHHPDGWKKAAGSRD